LASKSKKDIFADVGDGTNNLDRALYENTMKQIAEHYNKWRMEIIKVRIDSIFGLGINMGLLMAPFRTRER